MHPRQSFRLGIILPPLVTPSSLGPVGVFSYLSVLGLVCYGFAGIPTKLLLTGNGLNDRWMVKLEGRGRPPV